MPHQPTISVRCNPHGTGWRCTVVVGRDAGATTHVVDVTAEDLQQLAPPGTRPARLVEASFRFLLDREPRESILREFDLPVIGRYFPEYEREIENLLDGATGSARRGRRE
jgi:hypothetical protein